QLGHRLDPGQHRRLVLAIAQEFLRDGEHEAAVLAGIEAVTELLSEHFPAAANAQHEDELPDRPQLLG
ncbi:hypothetical protein G3N88_20685, partial [Xanthomonas hortorum pv. gardneri]